MRLTAVGSPEFTLNGCDARFLARGELLRNGSNDVQPRNDSPKTVLLTDVVASSAETLLSANAELAGIEKVAEELPAGGDLVALQALGLRDKIDGARSGHTSGQTLDTVLLEVRNLLRVVGNDGKRITRGNEGIGTVNHVAVTITIAGSSELDAVLVNRSHE